MSKPELVHLTNDELIAELINRQTFAGVVVWHKENARSAAMPADRLKHMTIEITKSPPLDRQGTERLLREGMGMLPRLFAERS